MRLRRSTGRTYHLNLDHTFLKGIGRWPPPFFFLFVRGWGDGYSPSIIKSKKPKKETGLVTSMFIILPYSRGPTIGLGITGPGELADGIPNKS